MGWAWIFSQYQLYCVLSSCTSAGRITFLNLLHHPNIRPSVHNSLRVWKNTRWLDVRLFICPIKQIKQADASVPGPSPPNNKASEFSSFHLVNRRQSKSGSICLPFKSQDKGIYNCHCIHTSLSITHRQQSIRWQHTGTLETIATECKHGKYLLNNNPLPLLKHLQEPCRPLQHSMALLQLNNEKLDRVVLYVC